MTESERHELLECRRIAKNLLRFKRLNESDMDFTAGILFKYLMGMKVNTNLSLEDYRQTECEDTNATE